MKRDVLTESVRRAAEELGYTFGTGPDNTLPARIQARPALWLCPLKLTGVEGRQECRATYHLTFYLISDQPACGADCETAWRILECDAEELFHRLPDDDAVTRTFNMRCGSSKAALTGNGELSLTVEMDAELFYLR